MKTKKFFLLVLLTCILLAACSPASKTTPIAESNLNNSNESPTENRQIIQVPNVKTSNDEGSPARIDLGLPGTASPLATQTFQPSGMSAEEELLYSTEPLPPYDNRFQDYGVNPFIKTSRDHLSTFALDVDTASYSVMRRYLDEGIIPPFESVRVEEYVNYFDPGYQSPIGERFAIYADGSINPFSPEKTYLLRFGIQGYDVSSSDRKPANLTVVIDVSGSMEMENRLGLVKRSLEYLVEQLDEDDRISIIVFGSNARVALEPTWGDSQREIYSVIRSLRTEGATNAEAGLRLGYRYAMAMYEPNSINRVILCSDGVANVGITGAGGILDQVNGYVSEGIQLTTIGFGMGNFNDVLMEQLADNGDGFYAYVDSLDEAQKLFVDKITSTLQVIAKDAKVQVDFNSDVVTQYRLIGYENRDIADEDFRNNQVDAGELGAGHHVVALYEVTLDPEKEGRIATVQLRWENPDTFEVKEINGNFNSWDIADNFRSTDIHYQLAVVVMQYAEVLRQSPWAWDVSINDLRKESDRIARSFNRDSDVDEFADLVERTSEIMRYQW
jgi:Ca-activated chloride channel family protein